MSDHLKTPTLLISILHIAIAHVTVLIDSLYEVASSKNTILIYSLSL